MSSCMRIALLAVLAVLVGAPLGETNQAKAGLIFNETFSGLTGPVTGAGAVERGTGTFLAPATIPGWTIEGDPSQIGGFDLAGDLSAYLNESGVAPNGISRTLTNLLPGFLHTLTFEYFGDNIVANYSFNYEINGVTTPISATHSGLNTGNFNTEIFTFTPLTVTTVLRFAETSATTASPLIDNISINAAVPEPSSLLALGCGAVLTIGAARLRRAKTGGTSRPY